MESLSVMDLLLLNAFVMMLIGFFGMMTRLNIMKIILSINILQTGVNLLLVALGYVENSAAPIITKEVTSLSMMSDPLPQALVLTSIVIGFGTTALALTVSIQYFKNHRTLELKKINEKESEREP